MAGSFGEFLKQKRKENNLTQKELSKLLFVSESTVSKWENGVAHPDITLLPQLSLILGVSEHELITASVDNKERKEKIEAKKWRTLSITWDLFFYIAYLVAILTCFICNLAVNKTLSWFFIVLASIILAFSITNLPKLITKNKLIFIPLLEYLALVLLLGVISIYTGGKWFFIPTLAVLFVLICIFIPIYIAKFEVFKKLRKVNEFISIFIDFIMLNILLLEINLYTGVNNFWYLKYALPIAFANYLMINLLLSVRFLKINKLLKTSVVLFLINIFVYIPPLFIKVNNASLQQEFNDINILNANLTNWQPSNLENNIHLIVFLSLLLLSVVFLITGLIFKKKNKQK